jgi:8-oxo-dGTP pyrophosphatase MutT (NUDIX family)
VAGITQEEIARKLLSTEQEEVSSNPFSEMPIDPDASLKCAAVLVPLIHADSEWHLLYTRRADRVESHKGQVSFPGGACDPGETTPEQTALREAHEEIGLDPRDVVTIGRLGRMVTISNFRVSPVVGVLPWPYAFKVAGNEVARIFTIPLAWLGDRRNFWEFFGRDSERSLIAYHPYDGEILWGATARMTVTFLKTIGLLK